MELNGSGRPLRESGKYIHPGSGQVVELQANPNIGTPMIDAFVQAGFEKAPEDEERKLYVKEESPKK
jgi:hypothetical protein